jgi:hypothetical protein
LSSIYLPDQFTGKAAKPSVVKGPDGKVRFKKNPLDRVHAERKAPKAWMQRLQQVWPKSDKTQWFQFRLFPEQVVRTGSGPSDFHVKAGSARWVLYTMTPAHLISDPTKIQQLAGTPWWELPTGEQWARQQMVSAYQWEMWRQHQCWARPYWCLQGDAGGTPMQYTMREKAVLKAHNLPTDVPDPGELPWADFDERVMAQLIARDKFRTLGHALDRLTDPAKAVADVKAEEADAEVVFRTEFVKWFKQRMEPNAEFLARHLSKSENQLDFRPATRSESNAADQWEDQYIATGTVPAANPE